MGISRTENGHSLSLPKKCDSHCGYEYLFYFLDKNAFLIFNPIEEIRRAEHGEFHRYLPLGEPNREERTPSPNRGPSQPPARWDRSTSLLPLLVFHTRSRQSMSIIHVCKIFIHRWICSYFFCAIHRCLHFWDYIRP